MGLKSIFIVIIMLSLARCDASAQTETHNSINVQSYHLRIEPNISRRYISGNVIIDFTIDSHTDQIVLDCGDININKIKGNSVKSFHQEGNKLFVNIVESDQTEYEIQIFYHGNPSRGILFLPAANQMYTVFSTEEWMICNNNPDDRATITTDLIVPDSLTTIASGVFRSQKKLYNKKVLSSWHQSTATPAYTYGFSIGPFNKSTDKYGNVSLNYYSSSYDTGDLHSIFSNTSDMLQFFEEKSGIPYFQTSYSQILIGSHYQEMAGFSVLKKGYGMLVLQDPTEQNLISHELAHQWWGNMITCKSWNHFWLNEAFATYMSAAYNKHRFGREKYMDNIKAYQEVYETIKNKGNDKPLVFEDWSNPSSDDRNLVYFKGAYVLHLLRLKLGDKAFWTGIKRYSQRYYGKSVTSKNFQEAMERSASVNLDTFFNKWVY